MNNFVIPIPPSYDEDQRLCCEDTQKYISYLEEEGAPVVMTTAGTSQYNLLSEPEIIKLNLSLSSFSRKKILGLPPLPPVRLAKFVDSQMSALGDLTNTSFMALYPDRFYDNQSVADYFSSVVDMVGNPIYIHSMFMRSGRGGQWNFTSDILNDLFERGLVVGIKEEYNDIMAAYNFILDLPKDMDIIVAGGSMRRHQFLKNAGAKYFLSGIGNLFPQIEKDYFNGKEEISLEKENEFFSVFNKHGWHRSLRIALSLMNLGCNYDRMPWPKRDAHVVEEIEKVLIKIGS